MKNNVQKLREALLMSKAELARRAGLSTLTIDRIEKGRDCRMETKRRIILALGLTLADKDFVFGDKEPDAELISKAANRLSMLDMMIEEAEKEEKAQQDEVRIEVRRKPKTKRAQRTGSAKRRVRR